MQTFQADFSAGGRVTGVMSRVDTVLSDAVYRTVRRVVVGVTVELVFQTQAIKYYTLCRLF